MRDELLFWGVWVLIPLLWEIFTGFVSGVLIVLLKFFRKDKGELKFYPTVSILIPVYRSHATLAACLDSIAAQNYPMDKFELLLLNNYKIKDKSYDIFLKFQEEHPKMKVRWYDTHAGKAKALNMGIAYSQGDYIINIDSDGWMDKNGILELVKTFEHDPSISALTGVVLIDPYLIQQTKGTFLKTMQRCEMFEYTESFLVGRNISSKFNSMYTLAGACSAFRRSVVKKRTYNFETVGEDTHMTFQVKEFAQGKAVLCNTTFFYVDPIEGVNKMYTQRQRWQRGQLEVAHLYQKRHLGNVWQIFRKDSLRIMVSDHTLAFPRLIWIFGMVYLYFVGYPLKILVGSNLILYGLYLLNSFIYLLAALMLLDKQEDSRKYLLKSIWVLPILPIYRSLIYWIRLAGVINSIKSKAKWTTLTLTDEMNVLKEGLDQTILNKFRKIIHKIEERLNE